MVGNGELKAKIEDKNRSNKLKNIKFLYRKIKKLN